MRHAKAEPFAEEDHQRMLTDRGRLEATAAGDWLASRGLLPTHAFVSSAARALGTWEAVARSSGATPVLVAEDGLYSAGPEIVVDSLRLAPADAGIVIFVGHNPTAASLAHLLDDGEPEEDAFRAMSEGYPTTAMAVLEVPVPWSELDAGSSRLVAFYPGHG